MFKRDVVRADSWAEFWLNGQAEAPSHRKLANGYQYAWSHSWNFAKPCILHDLMVYLRTDRKTGDYYGYYTKPLGYQAQGALTYKTNAAYSCKQLYVSICVDSPFASEDRSMNDNEVIIWNRRIDAVSTHPASRYDTGASPAMAYTDMVPNSPEDNTGAGGDSLWGFLYRLSDMNIPIHRNARVRMAIAVPWYSEITTMVASAPVTGEGNIRKGWADPYGSSTVQTTMFQKSYWQGAASEAECPLGTEPMGGLSINGCLTTLEEAAK